MFTNEPDFTGYAVRTPDRRIFDAAGVKAGHAPPVKMDAPQ
jgi:hypothetical protein